MIQRKRFAIIFVCLLLFSTYGLQHENVSAAEPNTQFIQSPTKTWTITFSKPVSTELQNLQKIYVQTGDNKKHDVSIQLSADSKKVIVDTKNPYLFGEVYTLIVPKEFNSANGALLKNEVTKSFQAQGESITSITAIANLLVTNIIVKTSADISKVTYSVNRSTAQTLIRNNNQFSRGQPGLIKGDSLAITAYNAQNKLIETQYYDVK